MIQSEILETIERYETVIIHRHVNPDPDALGSQGGLAAALRAAYPNKRILTAGDDNGNLSWLLAPMAVEDADYDGALVIAVDTADTPRVSDRRFDKGAFLIKIDHHPDVDQYGDLRWVDEDASSTSELIADLIQESNGTLLLDQTVALLLYAGIVGDTGRFTFNNTTPHTLRVAADLIETGIDFSALNNRMNQITLAQARLQGYVFEHLEVTAVGSATCIIPRTTVISLGLSPDEVHAAVGTPGRLGNVISWAMFVEQDEGNYRVNLRSKGPIINPIAVNHNGGGHPLASGAKAKDASEIAQIKAELQQTVAAFQEEQNDI